MGLVYCLNKTAIEKKRPRVGLRLVWVELDYNSESKGKRGTNVGPK